MSRVFPPLDRKLQLRSDHWSAGAARVATRLGLQAKSFDLEHNFGHGQQYLSLVLVMLNIFAFLFHTVLDLCDTRYRQVRAELVARQTFFNDVQASTRYHFFADWQALIQFMATGLELNTS